MVCSGVRAPAHHCANQRLFLLDKGPNFPTGALMVQHFCIVVGEPTTGSAARRQPAPPETLNPNLSGAAAAAAAHARAFRRRTQGTEFQDSFWPLRGPISQIEHAHEAPNTEGGCQRR